MKLKPKLPITRLGKTSLLLITFTLVVWLFVNNAQNCLSRDFVTQAAPAVCWRATNDYESTIAQSQVVYFALLILAIICSSATISKLRIRHSHVSASEHKKTALFLATISALLLVFIVTVFEVWQRTTYNNNNYFLNTSTYAVVKTGVPIWLAVTTAAITYGLKSLKSRKN